MPSDICFSQIDPCVRYAREGSLTPINLGEVCARDNRLFYLYEGDCALCLSGERFSLTGGTAALLPAGTAYRFEVTGKRMPRLFSVNFDLTRDRGRSCDSPFPLLPGAFPLAEAERERTVSDCEALCRPLRVTGAEALEPILAEMQREYVGRRRFFERQLSALMLRALILLTRQTLWEDETQPDAVERMIAFIQARYASPLTNEEVAAVVSYHPVHAGRLMRLHTGRTIHQYLLACRLQKALELLLNTSLPITGVALQTGFSSASRFTRRFREATGHTPSEFRRARLSGTNEPDDASKCLK